MSGDIIGGNMEACPPPSAERLSGDFFRFLFYGDTAVSWKSRLELGRDLTDDKCREAAVSLMTSSKAVEKSKKRHPAFKKKMVARIKIEESHGFVEIDKPDHANWWHPIGFLPHEHSEVVSL